MIAARFGVARDSVKLIIARELGHKNSQGDGSHLSEGSSKKARLEFSRDLLEILEDHQELQFGGMAAGNYSWLQYLIQFDAVTLRIRAVISAEKTF
jgi:hypothetical protein